MSNINRKNSSILFSLAFIGSVAAAPAFIAVALPPTTKSPSKIIMSNSEVAVINDLKKAATILASQEKDPAKVLAHFGTVRDKPVRYATIGAALENVRPHSEVTPTNPDLSSVQFLIPPESPELVFKVNPKSSISMKALVQEFGEFFVPGLLYPLTPSSSTLRTDSTLTYTDIQFDRKIKSGSKNYVISAVFVNDSSSRDPLEGKVISVTVKSDGDH